MPERPFSQEHPVLLLLLSPLMVAGGLAAILGLSILIHLTVAKSVPAVELFFALLFFGGFGALGVFRSRRGGRGRLRNWEVQEKLDNRRR